MLFALAAWAIAGMILMVIIGRISPPPPAPPAPPGPPLPTTPDPMHATFLMLHLGALAPVAALVAWLLFGAVVGATSVNVEKARAPGGARSHRGTQTVAAGGVVAPGRRARRGCVDRRRVDRERARSPDGRCRESHPRHRARAGAPRKDLCS